MAKRTGHKPNHLISSFLLTIFLPRFAFSTTPGLEIEALRALKEGVDPYSIPESSFLSTWDFNYDPCDNVMYFLGIQCAYSESNSTTRVIAIELDSVGYDGFVSERIGNLSKLTTLNLSKNKFRGAIPETISNLKNLKTLLFFDNFLTGSLSEGMAKLKSVQDIDLSNNKFTSLIPEWITGLRGLRSLCLSNNIFSGQIPNLAGLWLLQTLDLSKNQLYGTLPWLPTSLVSLSLSQNLLSGHVSSLSRLPKIMTLDVSNNRFSGSISRGVFSLPELSRVNFSVNQFTSIQVADFSGRSTKLQVLDAQKNRLKGHLPANLVTLEKLTDINLSNNQFSGAIPSDYGTKLGDSWSVLYLNDNFLVGNLPSQFGDSLVKTKGSLAQNCLMCPTVVPLCLGGQRLASECVRKKDVVEQKISMLSKLGY